MNKRMMRIMSVVLAGGLLLSGCGNTESDSGKGGSSGKFVLTDEEAVITPKNARKGFEGLMKKALTYAEQNDMDSFRSLYRNTDRKEIEKEFENIRDIAAKNYPDWQYYNVADDEKYFAVGFLNSWTTGTLPRARSLSTCGTWCVSYGKGKWKFDKSKEAQALFEKKVRKLCQKECLKAYEDGRNAIFFNPGDYSWIDTNITLPGAVEAKVYQAWQNKDGSIGLMFSLRNGSDEIQNISEVCISLEDENLGRIIDITCSGATIAPHKSESYTLAVDAEEVNTGTAKWGNVQEYHDVMY